MTLTRATEASEQRLLFFFYDPPRAGYLILDHEDELLLRFEGDVKTAAKIRMEKLLLWLAGHDFHLYESFVHQGVEYHPVLLEFGDAYAHDTAVLHMKGFEFVPLLQHPLGSPVRRARHVAPVHT